MKLRFQVEFDTDTRNFSIYEVGTETEIEFSGSSYYWVRRSYYDDKSNKHMGLVGNIHFLPFIRESMTDEDYKKKFPDGNPNKSMTFYFHDEWLNAVEAKNKLKY